MTNRYALGKKDDRNPSVLVTLFGFMDMENTSTWVDQVVASSHVSRLGQLILD